MHFSAVFVAALAATANVVLAAPVAHEDSLNIVRAPVFAHSKNSFFFLPNIKLIQIAERDIEARDPQKRNGQIVGVSNFLFYK